MTRTSVSKDGNPVPLVIYHANCLDGFGAAFAAWKHFGEEAEYLPMDYADRAAFMLSHVERVANRAVYVLDFSFSKEDTIQLVGRADYFVMLDHHKSTFENFAGEERQYCLSEEIGMYKILLDNSKSGAVLAWEYFAPLWDIEYDPAEGDTLHIPQFLLYIQDRDLWKFLHGEATKDFCKGLSQLAQDFEVWDDMLRIENVIEILNKGAVINDYYQTQLSRAIASTKETCNILGSIGLCCNLPPMFASEAGHELANESGTFGATWFKDKAGNIKWSLRSNGDYDVSILAKRFGGGGHKNAAGFTLVPESGMTESGVKLWSHTGE